MAAHVSPGLQLKSHNGAEATRRVHGRESLDSTRHTQTCDSSTTHTHTVVTHAHAHCVVLTVGDVENDAAAVRDEQTERLGGVTLQTENTHVRPSRRRHTRQRS